jgi:hypothetical protein
MQKQILAWVLRAYRQTETVNLRTGKPVNQSDPVDRAQLRHLEHWGVHIWKRGARNRSASASRSRALRRLEDRGLIVRRNSISGDHAPSMFGTQTRTVEIRFTEAGRKLAESLDVTG